MPVATALDQAVLCRPANDCPSEVEAEMNGNRGEQRESGFTIMQMVITLAIIAIVSTFGVLGAKSAREHFRMQSSARLFASYVEKARADSVRRHAASGQEAAVEMFGEGTTTYNVTMDYGSGTVETRTFQLDPGITFDTIASKVTFDWRGRLLTQAVVFQVRSDYLNDSIPVDVSGSGDVTVWSQQFPDQLIPAVTVSTPGDDVDHGTPTPTPTPTATPTPTPSPSPGDSPSPTPTATATPGNNGNGNGGSGNNGNGPNSTPTPTPTPTPTSTPSPSPTATPIPQCVSTVSPSTLTLSQSVDANKTGTATFTIVNATGVRTISASQAGNGNSLVIGLSLARLDGSGSSVVSVTTKNGAGNRGSFTVNIATTPACGTGAQLTVVVNN
jgi:hypothetical protein